jgi:hypothetical protein
VPVGYRTYFLAQDGFCMTNGAEVINIGGGRVNEWLFDNVNQTYVSHTHGAVDWKNECVVWAFKESGSTSFDRLMIYSWTQDRWSTGTLTLHRLVGTRRDATSLEDLDALFPSGLDDVTPSLDDDIWKAGNRVLAAFVGVGSETTFATLDGDTLQAEWETGAWQPRPGGRVFVSEAHPIFDATDWTMQCAAVPADNSRVATIGAYNSPGAAGFCPLRADGRLMRISLRTVAGDIWDKGQGVQVKFRDSGGGR